MALFVGIVTFKIIMIAVYRHIIYLDDVLAMCLQAMRLYLVWDSEAISTTKDTIVEDLFESIDRDSSSERSPKKSKKDKNKKRKRSTSSEQGSDDESAQDDDDDQEQSKHSLIQILWFMHLQEIMCTVCIQWLCMNFECAVRLCVFSIKI